jgi:hypothetical protein
MSNASSESAVYLAFRFHVNFYHSYRGDAPDETGIGKDIRIIRGLIRDLDALNAAGIPVRGTWDIENYYSLELMMPRHCPDIIDALRRRIGEGLDEVEPMSYNNGLLSAHTPQEFSAAVGRSLHNEAGSGLRDLFGTCTPLIRPQEMVYTPAMIGALREAGIQALSLYYSAVPFNAFSNFIPPLSIAERHNPLMLVHPDGSPRMPLLPAVNHGDLADRLSLRRWLKELRRQQLRGTGGRAMKEADQGESGAAAEQNRSPDLLLLLDMDADDAFWEGYRIPLISRLFRMAQGFRRLVESVADLPWLRFTTPGEYLAGHEALREITIGQDTADGSFDGYSSWTEKWSNHELWTRLDRSRLTAAYARALLAAPRVTGQGRAAGAEAGKTAGGASTGVGRDAGAESSDSQAAGGGAAGAEFTDTRSAGVNSADGDASGPQPAGRNGAAAGKKHAEQPSGDPQRKAERLLKESFEARLRLLSTTHFGLSAPIMNRDRLNEAQRLARQAEETAHSALEIAAGRPAGETGGVPPGAGPGAADWPPSSSPKAAGGNSSAGSGASGRQSSSAPRTAGGRIRWRDLRGGPGEMRRRWDDLPARLLLRAPLDPSVLTAGADGRGDRLRPAALRDSRTGERLSAAVLYGSREALLLWVTELAPGEEQQADLELPAQRRQGRSDSLGKEGAAAAESSAAGRSSTAPVAPAGQGAGEASAANVYSPPAAGHRTTPAGEAPAAAEYNPPTSATGHTSLAANRSTLRAEPSLLAAGGLSLRFREGIPMGLSLNGETLLAGPFLRSGITYGRGRGRIYEIARWEPVETAVCAGEFALLRFRGRVRFGRGRELRVEREFLASARLPYLWLSVRVSYPQTAAYKADPQKVRNLGAEYDWRWQEVWPAEIRPDWKAPFTVWKHNYWGEITSYRPHYASFSANRSLPSFNNHVTAGWVAVSGEGKGLLVGQSVRSRTAAAFCPMRTVRQFGSEQLRLNPFGTYRGPQLHSPIARTGIGRLAAQNMAEQLHSLAPSYNGQEERFELLLAPYSGDRPPQQYAADAWSNAFPPLILADSGPFTNPSGPIPGPLYPPSETAEHAASGEEP